MTDLLRRLRVAACRAKGVDPYERLGAHPPPTSADGMTTYDVMIHRYRWHDEVEAVSAVAGELLAALREPTTAVPASAGTDWDGWRDAVGTFAREHGREAPDGG